MKHIQFDSAEEGKATALAEFEADYLRHNYPDLVEDPDAIEPNPEVEPPP